MTGKTLLTTPSNGIVRTADARTRRLPRKPGTATLAPRDPRDQLAAACAASGTSQRGGTSGLTVTRNARASLSPGLRRLYG